MCHYIFNFSYCCKCHVALLNSFFTPEFILTSNNQIFALLATAMHSGSESTWFLKISSNFLSKPWKFGVVLLGVCATEV